MHGAATGRRWRSRGWLNCVPSPAADITRTTAAPSRYCTRAGPRAGRPAAAQRGDRAVGSAARTPPSLLVPAAARTGDREGHGKHAGPGRHGAGHGACGVASPPPPPRTACAPSRSPTLRRGRGGAGGGSGALQPARRPHDRLLPPPPARAGRLAPGVCVRARRQAQAQGSGPHLRQLELGAVLPPGARRCSGGQAGRRACGACSGSSAVPAPPSWML